MQPEAIIQQRALALKSGDFKAIYNSYHPKAPFRQQFPDLSAYLHFAEEQISHKIHLENFQILKKRQKGRRAELLIHHVFRVSDHLQETLELAILEAKSHHWKFLGSYRMARSDFEGNVADLDFSDFDDYPTKVFI